MSPIGEQRVLRRKHSRNPIAGGVFRRPTWRNGWGFTSVLHTPIVASPVVSDDFLGAG
jgi:hypothetical protein